MRLSRALSIAWATVWLVEGLLWGIIVHRESAEILMETSNLLQIVGIVSTVGAIVITVHFMLKQIRQVEAQLQLDREIRQSAVEAAESSLVRALRPLLTEVRHFLWEVRAIELNRPEFAGGRFV